MSKILIVEDEETIADLEKDYLELSSFEVEIETDGQQGLEKALKNDFDMIILDIMLPGVDGFEICKQIREAKEIPILMVSARKEDIDKIRGLGLGADDYMVKEVPSGAKEQALSSYTVAYDRQSSENTTINICGTQELSQDEITAMHSSTTDPGELAKLYDKVFKDTVITCTVTFTDGTSQKRQIGIGGAVMTYEELGTQTDEPVESPEDPSQKQAFLKLQIK